MGRVISMEAWKQGLGGVAPSVEELLPESAAVDRLERAILRLDGLVGRTRLEGGPASGDIDLETELLAIKGALSLSRYGEAAERAERLAARLAGPVATRA